MALLPARLQSDRFGQKAARLWEEDEDFWSCVRRELLSGLNVPEETFVATLKSPSSRCLLNASVFPPGNIRTHLTLFEKVILVAPLAEFHRDALQSLVLSESELLELAAKGRLLCVFPQSIERYEPRFVSTLAERAPEAMLLSRRLAAETVVELRSRLPLVFWPLTTEERLEVLRFPGRAHVQSPLASGLAAISKDITDIWRDLEWSLTLNGALATGFLGLGRVIAGLIREMAGIERTIELTSAAASVEWAAALDAVVIPCSNADYSEQASSEIIAVLYSGVPNTEIDVGVADAQALALDLLAIESEAPVLELTDALTCTESSQIVSIAQHLYRQSAGQDRLTQLVAEHNIRVREFEKRGSRLQATLNLVLPAAAMARLAVPDLRDLPEVITLAAWLLGKMALSGNSVLGRLGDRIGSLILRSSPDIVLTSRIRRRLRA